MKNKYCDDSSFYDFGDTDEGIGMSKCDISGMIKFDGVCMILSHRNYKRYKRFLKKELGLRKDSELNKRNIKKWSK